MPAGGPFDTPIDTSVTLWRPPWRSNKPFEPNARSAVSPLNAINGRHDFTARNRANARSPNSPQPLVIVDHSKEPVEHAHTQNSGGQGSSAPNSIGAAGAHVQDRAKAALERAQARTAIGSPASGNLGGAAASPASRVVTNAIGVTVKLGPISPGTNVDEHKAGFVPAGRSASGAMINGRDLIRPGANVGAIGGPNHMAGGIIRGSDFHPKIP
jgi:hypothetical protein